MNMIYIIQRWYRQPMGNVIHLVNITNFIVYPETRLLISSYLRDF